MSEPKEFLGKIASISVGMGGYQDAMFGVSITLSMSGPGIDDFKGTWADPPSDHAKWTVSDQDKTFSNTSRWLIDLLKKAKKRKVSELKDMPVRVWIKGDVLDRWEVLTEVL